MTPVEMAGLHAASFATPRPWTSAEFAELLASPLCFVVADPKGFLIGRAAADEAELLTLAVDPAARRQGIGKRLVAGFLAEARARGTSQAFLEVSAENRAAISLYLGMGFSEAGRRKNYYSPPSGGPVDALVMRLDLPSMINSLEI